ncbi:hypothetical protein DFQ11_10296 [Winogradskyella epiphytica]|uniref:Uncharacterized protein n=1 Tax=Winogradskyella epiphytica TaxID=262005 RepID=A0A2V4WWZ5_9FLAO|nr:hypothetical protein [Winogradskyella epiphytica]PYE81522.1 hypothetical protein DFQ11_10296 [Winogradskyella epiphytica]GGW64558.1 hypothetical protein GCM10008085_15710 [Winogradskyella epiphytica]
MSIREELSSKSAKTAFDKKVLSAIPHLHPYVKHRIYIAETTGILPKNMFSSNGLIDESIILLYDKGFNVDAEPMAVRLELFKIVDNFMNVLFKNEAYHKNTISTDEILKKELDKLGEDYTVDADFDYILNTELNDISYHQDQSEPLHLYSDKETSLLKAFDLKDLSNHQSPKVFGQLYNWLPFNVSNIVDLYIFGKLDFESIAKIKKIEQKRVEDIFSKVKRTFRRHIE